MVSRKKAVGIVGAVTLVAVLVGLAWSQEWVGGGGGEGPPGVSPVSATLACVRTAPGAPWRATVTNVSQSEPLSRYEVTLHEVPTDTKIVDRERVRDRHIAGTDQVSLSYEDADGDLRMTEGDAFVIGSAGPGPYDVTVLWEENGGTVTAFRCS